MTIWVLHLPLTPEEEGTIASRAFLPAPLDSLPDLSMVNSAAECKSLLRAMWPDEPPETLNRRVERVWKIYSEVQVEDIFAVPLPGREEVALAEVIGPYAYRVGAGGSDEHSFPVKWHEKRAPYRAFRGHRELLKAGDNPMREVGEKEARDIIRDRLPHPWNRFVWIKWLFVLFIGWRMIQYVINLYNDAPPM